MSSASVVVHAITNEKGEAHVSQVKSGWFFRWVGPLAASYSVVSLLTACGPAMSDKTPGPGSRASAEASTVGAPTAGTRGAEAGNGFDLSTRNDQGARSPDQSVAETDDHKTWSIPGVPDSVARDLGSADPRDRYRALDHWNVKGGSAPLDAVFAAMEDEDEEVREKATAIVGKRWAEKQQKERG